MKQETTRNKARNTKTFKIKFQRLKYHEKQGEMKDEN